MGRSSKRLDEVLLIACGRKKVEGAAPARDFYAGRPTQAVIAEAEATGKPVFILSARLGLVGLDDVIVGPYEQHLDDLTEAELDAWLDRVRRSLSARGAKGAKLTYVGSAPAYRAAVDRLVHF